MREERESSTSRGDTIGTHVWLQRFRNVDAAVGVLIIFHDRHPRPSYRQSAAVQCVNEFGLILSLRTIADVRASCLERFEIRAGGNFTEQPLPGQPDFEVVGFRRRESHVGGAERYHAVMQAELLKYGL